LAVVAVGAGVVVVETTDEGGAPDARGEACDPHDAHIVSAANRTTIEPARDTPEP